MQAVTELSSTLGIKAACEALALPRASFYRQQSPLFGPRLRRPIPAPALRPEERDAVRWLLNGERFQDCSPAAMCATWLDQGQYPCSARTMDRVLAQDGAVRANAAIISRIRRIRNRNYWPPLPTSCGAGTSLNCAAL